MNPTPPMPEVGVELGAADDLRPNVARAPRGLAGPLTLGAAVLAGAVVFVAMSTHRQGTKTPAPIGRGSTQAPISAEVPPELAALQRASREPPPLPASVTDFAPAPFNATAMAFAAPNANLSSSGALGPDLEHRRAPALVVDFSAGPSGAQPGAAATSGAALAAKASPNGLNADEQFAERVGGGQADVAKASLIAHPQFVVPQGATIPAVLETALNSDLPGFARAVVSQDVRSFDGSRVVIPRGSRAIGQYRSAVAQGQTRAFVIWTRIVRPDGAAIQIGSPGADPLGRAGLEGKVDRHFFEAFGGSILLSVINAAVTGLSNQGGSQIIIGSTQDAISLGTAATRPTALSPTIKVAQGAPVRIFVAKDLDFSTVPDLSQ